MRNAMLVVAVCGLFVPAAPLQAGGQREPQPMSEARAQHHERTRQAEQLIHQRAAQQAQERRARLAARKQPLAPLQSSLVQMPVGMPGTVPHGRVQATYNPTYVETLYLSNLATRLSPVPPDLGDTGGMLP